MLEYIFSYSLSERWMERSFSHFALAIFVLGVCSRKRFKYMVDIRCLCGSVAEQRDSKCDWFLEYAALVWGSRRKCLSCI